MKTAFVGFAVLAVLSIGAGIGLFAGRGSGDDSGDGAGAPSSAAAAPVRPAAVYRPKAEPLRRAERPALSSPAAPESPEAPDAPEAGDDEASGDGGDADEAVAVAPPPVLRDDDPGLAALEPERLFADTVWDALAASPEELVPEAARLLASGEPEERAFGGVLAFFGNVLEGELLEGVASDPEPRLRNRFTA